MRSDEFDLAQQIGLAGLALGGPRRAIFRRPALHYIGDVHIFAALQANCRQHIVEQLAGLANEGFAALVLLCTGRFADEQPLRLYVADPQHGLLACLVQYASGA